MNCEQFDTFARLLPEPLLLVSSDGEIRAANAAAEKAAGRSLEQLQEKRLVSLVEEPAETVAQFLRSCSRTRQMIPGRLTWQSSNGHPQQTQWEGTVVQPWSPGSPALLLLRQKHDQMSSSRFVLLSQKIDELTHEIRARKQAEKRMAFLAEASSRLSRSLDYETTLRQVAHLVIPDLADWFVATLFHADKPNNDAFDQVIIAHKDEAKEEIARTLRHRYPPDPWASHGSTHVIRTGEAEFYPQITDELLVEAAQNEEHLRLLRKVGMQSAMIVPMKARGRTIGALALVREDTSHQYTEADLQFAEELGLRVGMHISNAQLYRDAEEARVHAEEMNRLKSAFLANMSHEIRTPLTGIIGLASLLERKISPEQQEYVQRIEAGGQRLLETLNAVLSLAQLEAQQHELKIEPLDVTAETREALDLLQQQAEDKGLVLYLDVQPGAEEARARLDRGAFNSILQNLVGNAIKYTEDGGIYVRIMTNPDHIAIDVEDTGIGINEEVLPHIFDAFWQESRGWGRTHEGVGIGLSITKRLVEQMNGEIEAHSTKGEGSSFTIRFPRATEASSDSAPSLSHEASKSTERPVRLLVVEDNADTRFFMRTLLEDMGEVKDAVNAEEALDFIRQVKNDAKRSDSAPLFDALVIDINLGAGKSGVDLLKELRQDPAFKDVPVVAVTAYAMSGDRERLLAEGFDAYLDKPFSADKLMTVIEEMLRR